MIIRLFVIIMASTWKVIVIWRYRTRSYIRFEKRWQCRLTRNICCWLVCLKTWLSIKWSIICRWITDRLVEWLVKFSRKSLSRHLRAWYSHRGVRIFKWRLVTDYSDTIVYPIIGYVRPFIISLPFLLPYQRIGIWPVIQINTIFHQQLSYFIILCIILRLYWLALIHWTIFW